MLGAAQPRKGVGVKPNPPIYRQVMQNLCINPFTPLERYRAYSELWFLVIDVNGQRERRRIASGGRSR